MRVGPSMFRKHMSQNTMADSLTTSQKSLVDVGIQSATVLTVKTHVMAACFQTSLWIPDLSVIPFYGDGRGRVKKQGEATPLPVTCSA